MDTEIIGRADLAPPIYHNLSDLIGNTPLLELHNYARKRSLPGRIVAKLEYFNPAGSVKDRIALSIIREAEARGNLRPGNLIGGGPPALRAARGREPAAPAG